MADGRPWITFEAARQLETLVHADSRVFEFGIGGSTVFFANRAKEVASVEHDPHWFERTSAAIRAQGLRNWQGELAQPTKADELNVSPSDLRGYRSSDASYTGYSFRKYASAIDRYQNESFDVILIDGRARPSCFVHAVPKLKLGGVIILDNAEREEYREAEALGRLLGFEVTEYWGPGPYNPYFWRTLFFRRSKRGFSLNDIDLKLETYLGPDSGVFVEAGANNGITQSNTLYLELYRGWRGLLVEPIPQLAAQCRMYRPRAIVEEVALVDTVLKRSVTMRYVNLMSVVKGGMKSVAEEEAHVQAGCEVQKVESYELEAPATTLGALLERHGLGRIDLLSLDVEGFEANALKGLDLEKHRPRYILVEARYRDEVNALLTPWYDLVAELSHHDLLYRAKPEST